MHICRCLFCGRQKRWLPADQSEVSSIKVRVVWAVFFCITTFLTGGVLLQYFVDAWDPSSNVLPPSPRETFDLWFRLLLINIDDCGKRTRVWASLISARSPNSIYHMDTGSIRQTGTVVRSRRTLTFPDKLWRMRGNFHYSVFGSAELNWKCQLISPFSDSACLLGEIFSHMMHIHRHFQRGGKNELFRRKTTGSRDTKPTTVLLLCRSFLHHRRCILTASTAGTESHKC